MEPASNILMTIPRTFVSVKLDGKETPVTDVYLTGNAHNQTTAFLPVSIQMTVSAQHPGYLTLKVFAAIQSLEVKTNSPQVPMQASGRGPSGLNPRSNKESSFSLD